MNYGSVRLAKSWLPNREWFDGNVQEDDWGFPLHVFIGSPQQRGLLLPCWSQRSMKVPQGLEHPCLSSTCSATGQSLCHHGFLVSSPAGRPSVLSCVCHCHRLSPLGSPGVLQGTAPAAGVAGAWKPRVPCGGCGGWQQCWRVKDQGSKFANDPLSHFQKRTSHQHLSVPSL